MAWVCAPCPTANEDTERECMVCGQERVLVEATEATGTTRAPWVCPLCSNVNEGGAPTCLVCDTTRPTETAAPSGVVTLTKKRAESLRLTGEVVIPEKYNAIGPEAFAGRSDITGLILHGGVKKIGKEAFRGCTNLRFIRADHELSSVGSLAFANCTSLTEGRDIRARYMAPDAFFRTTSGSGSAERGSTTSWREALAAAAAPSDSSSGHSWRAALDRAASGSAAPASSSGESAASRLARELSSTAGLGSSTSSSIRTTGSATSSRTSSASSSATRTTSSSTSTSSSGSARPSSGASGSSARSTSSARATSLSTSSSTSRSSSASRTSSSTSSSSSTRASTTSSSTTRASTSSSSSARTSTSRGSTASTASRPASASRPSASSSRTSSRPSSARSSGAGGSTGRSTASRARGSSSRRRAPSRGGAFRFVRGFLVSLVGAVIGLATWALAAAMSWNSLTIFHSGVTVGYLVAFALLYLWKRLGDEDGCVDIVLYRVVEATFIVAALHIASIIFGGITALVAMGASGILLLSHIIIYLVTRRHASRDRKMHVNIAVGAFFGVLLSLLVYFVGR